MPDHHDSAATAPKMYCRSRADDYCAMPGSFLQAYLTQHQAQVPVGPSSPIPEPGTLPLLLVGLAVVGWLAKRR